MAPMKLRTVCSFIRLMRTWEMRKYNWKYEATTKWISTKWAHYTNPRGKKRCNVSHFEKCARGARRYSYRLEGGSTVTVSSTGNRATAKRWQATQSKHNSILENRLFACLFSFVSYTQWSCNLQFTWCHCTWTKDHPSLAQLHWQMLSIQSYNCKRSAFKIITWMRIYCARLFSLYPSPSPSLSLWRQWQNHNNKLYTHLYLCLG